MGIKNKEPIQAALDSLEMALENLEDKEEYTLNDVSVKDLWDIWEEASHILGVSDGEDKDEMTCQYSGLPSTKSYQTKHFADGFHEGEWERDIEVPRPWPGLDEILKEMDIPKEWESVKTMTYDEFVKEYGELTAKIKDIHGNEYDPKVMSDEQHDFSENDSEQKYIYESPDGGKTIYRRKLNGDDERELISKDEEE